MQARWKTPRTTQALRYHEHYRSARGWTARARRAIIENADGQPPLNAFFDWICEFRELKPTPVCSVTTTDDERRRLDGAPERIDIVQYRPEPLFYLRFHYAEPERVERGRLLWKNGHYISSRESAVLWVKDELGIAPSEWREPPN